jgi:cation:H+ antiporter
MPISIFMVARPALGSVSSISLDTRTRQSLFPRIAIDGPYRRMQVREHPVHTRIVTAIGSVLLLLALVLAGLGSRLFVGGLENLARRWSTSDWVLAGSLDAAATSAPELCVSWFAALEGRPQLGLGDALGSNVVNTALILGLALAWGPVARPATLLRRDVLLALAAPVLLALGLSDGTLERLEAGGILILFLGWLSISLRRGPSSTVAWSAPVTEGHTSAGPWRAWGRLTMGVLMLGAAGQAFVSGASEIAKAAGVNEFIIGSSLVAVGTSLPELATMVAAQWRRNSDLGLGTLLGSTLFNGLAIVGSTGLLAPISVDFAVTAPALTAGLSALLILVPGTGPWQRWRSLPLLTVYLAYLWATAWVA